VLNLLVHETSRLLKVNLLYARKDAVSDSVLKNIPLVFIKECFGRDVTGGSRGLIEDSFWFYSLGAGKRKENYSLYNWCNLRYSISIYASNKMFTLLPLVADR
jgi:hypothetical protein